MTQPTNSIDSELEWRKIPEFPNYEVTETGLIRSSKKVLTPHISPKGYAVVNLHKDGKQYHRRLHRLVLGTFVPNNNPELVACHNDGNKANNTLQNLRWDTPRNNVLDMAKHGTTARNERHGCAKLNRNQVMQIRELVSKGVSQYKIARDFNIHRSLVYLIKERKIWKNI